MGFYKMTKKVFTQEEEAKVFDKLNLLNNLLLSKNASIEDMIELRSLINQVSINTDKLEISVEVLKNLNRLWKKYNVKKKN